MRTEQPVSIAPAYNLSLRSPKQERTAPYIKVGAGESAERMMRNVRVLNLRENKERYTNAFIALGNMVLASNVLCGSVMLDAVDKLKQDGRLWRHSVKRYANEACKEYSMYYHSIDRGVFNMDIYMDFADAYIDGLKKHVDILRLSVFQVLTRLGILHREAISYVATAYACLCVAADIYEFLERRLNSLVQEQVSTEYTNRNMRHIRGIWCKLVYSLITKQTEDKICHDKDYLLACRILYKEMTDMELADRSNVAALKKNRDKFTDEEWDKLITEV